MKLDRLVGILVVLLRKERVQAKELAERFGVSVRTILRDVDAINLAGIPIVTYQGAGGGIGIAEGYRLDKSVLTGDDMAAIITALRGIDGVMTGKSHDILMEKLKNTLPAPQLDTLNTKLKQLIIDLSPWYEDTRTKEKLAIIRKAIEDTRRIEFVYADSEGKKTSRRAEPYSLVLKAQKWYLYAWCLLRNDFRYFKVSRIKELAVLDETYTPREAPPENIPDEREWYRNGKPVTLDLLFIEELENLVAEWFGDDIEKSEDGRLMVRATLPENYWLYGYLLSFGTGVEVVSPPHIRSILAEISKGIYEKYTS
jgi:predicted DNA-binding transcriptional regulator YafY